MDVDFVIGIGCFVNSQVDAKLLGQFSIERNFLGTLVGLQKEMCKLFIGTRLFAEEDASICQLAREKMGLGVALPVEVTNCPFM